jgi:hypothetical protein
MQNAMIEAINVSIVSLIITQTFCLLTIFIHTFGGESFHVKANLIVGWEFLCCYFYGFYILEKKGISKLRAFKTQFFQVAHNFSQKSY